MTTADLVTVGETMLRLSPAKGERIETATELDFRAAGAESNVAVTAARLGVDAVWLSKLPDNALGRKVTASVQSHGVTTDVAWSKEGRQGTYYLEFGTKPRGTNVIYDRENAAVTTATADELDLERVQDASIFYTSGITPALSETLETTVSRLLGEARAHDTTTAFDLNYRSKLWTPDEARETIEKLLPDVDVLVTAARDARSVLGLSGDGETIATSLHDTYEHETVVITRGDEGALALTDDRVVEQPVYETETVDPIGTGDAFVGAFLARRIEGDDLAVALDHAAAAAALKRTMHGDIAVVTPAEIASLRERDERGIDR